MLQMAYHTRVSSPIHSKQRRHHLADELLLLHNVLPRKRYCRNYRKEQEKEGWVDQERSPFPGPIPEIRVEWELRM